MHPVSECQSSVPMDLFSVSPTFRFHLSLVKLPLSSPSPASYSGGWTELPACSVGLQCWCFCTELLVRSPRRPLRCLPLGLRTMAGSLSVWRAVCPFVLQDNSHECVSSVNSVRGTFYSEHPTQMIELSSSPGHMSCLVFAS